MHEKTERLAELEEPPTRQPLTATFGLLLVASTGLTFQIVTDFVSLHHSMAIFPSVAWVCIPTFSSITTDIHRRLL